MQLNHGTEPPAFQREDKPAMGGEPKRRLAALRSEVASVALAGCALGAAAGIWLTPHAPLPLQQEATRSAEPLCSPSADDSLHSIGSRLAPAWARAPRRSYEPTPVPPLWVGATLYRLSPASGFVLLPPQGLGYYHFGGTDDLDEDAWGEPVAVACIEAVGRAWAQAYPHRPRIGIGDMSRAAGGAFPPHREHRAGLDIDVRPINADGEERVAIGHAAFDRTATADLIELFVGTCTVDRVLFNDVAIGQGMGIVDRARGHSDHIHFGLAPPEAQPEVLRDAALSLLGWLEVASEAELSAAR